MIKNKLIV